MEVAVYKQTSPQELTMRNQASDSRLNSTKTLVRFKKSLQFRDLPLRSELRRAARYSVFQKRERMLEEHETPSHPMFENSFSIEKSLCDAVTVASSRSITSFKEQTGSKSQGEVKFAEVRCLPKSESPSRIGKFKVRIFNGEMSETQNEAMKLKQKERHLMERNKERRCSVAISESLSLQLSTQKSSKFKPKGKAKKPAKKSTHLVGRRMSTHETTIAPSTTQYLPTLNRRSCNCAKIVKNSMCPIECSCKTSLPASLYKCSRTRLGLYSHPERTLQAILERGKEMPLRKEPQRIQHANAMLGEIIQLASRNNIFNCPSSPPAEYTSFKKEAELKENAYKQRQSLTRRAMNTIHQDFKTKKALELKQPLVLTEKEKEELVQREMDLEAELIAESKQEDYIPLSKLIQDVEWKAGVKKQIAREIRRSLMR